MYDLVVLGGGPAGYYAAEQAGASGLNTVLIEKRHVGGVCLNEGCVPSKTILYSAKLYSQAKGSEKFGVTASNVTFDLGKVIARKQKIVEMLRKGITSTLKKNKVDVISGDGHILRKEGDAFRVQVKDEVVEAKRLLICTGSEAIRIPVPGGDQDFVYTNREILDVKEIPEEFVVVGGGVIGLEIATFFAEIGSKVTVVEMLPKIGGPIDSELSDLLLKEMKKKGVEFKLNAKMTSIGDHTVTYNMDGKDETIGANLVLMSVGRRPVTKGVGLENLNIALERGAVITDERGRTNVPNVWAAGDVNGKSMLAHTAYREGDVAIMDMIGQKNSVRYNNVPAVIYTHPEVATVGYTEEDAKKAGFDVKTQKLPMSFNGRYLAETEAGKGFCKVVVDKKYGTLLGVHMIGSASSEMIAGATAMIEDEMRIQDIRDIVFPHPTVSEIIKDTLMHVKL